MLIETQDKQRITQTNQSILRTYPPAKPYKRSAEEITIEPVKAFCMKTIPINIDRINGLKSLKSNLTDADKQEAVDKIIAIMKCCLDSGNAQQVFDESKDTLKSKLYSLRDALSILNTILNAVVTCLVVCSLIAIPILYLSGTWENNKRENGSYFSFFKFGDAQKAESEIAKISDHLKITTGL